MNNGVQILIMALLTGLLLTACGDNGGGSREGGDYDFTAKEIAQLQPSRSKVRDTGQDPSVIKDFKLQPTAPLPGMVNTQLPSELKTMGTKPTEAEYSTDGGNNNYVYFMYVNRSELTDSSKLRKATMDELTNFKQDLRRKPQNQDFSQLELLTIGQPSAGQKAEWAKFSYKSVGDGDTYLHTNYMKRTRDKLFQIGLVFSDQPDNLKLYEATKYAVEQYTGLKAK